MIDLLSLRQPRRRLWRGFLRKKKPTNFKHDLPRFSVFSVAAQRFRRTYLKQTEKNKLEIFWESHIYCLNVTKTNKQIIIIEIFFFSNFILFCCLLIIITIRNLLVFCMFVDQLKLYALNTMKRTRGSVPPRIL